MQGKLEFAHILTSASHICESILLLKSEVRIGKNKSVLKVKGPVHTYVLEYHKNPIDGDPGKKAVAYKVLNGEKVVIAPPANLRLTLMRMLTEVMKEASLRPLLAGMLTLSEFRSEHPTAVGALAEALVRAVQQ